MKQDVNEYITKAQTALEKHNFDYAVDLLKSCLERDPFQAQARTLLHHCYRKKRGDKGTSQATQVLGRFQLSLAQLGVKKVTPENAGKYLDKLETVVENNPHDISALQALAEARSWFAET